MKKLYGGLYFSEGSLDTLVYKLSSLASCFQLKKNREMFWVIVFTVMMLFSIVANCILIWIILGKPIFSRLSIYFKANVSSFVFLKRFKLEILKCICNIFFKFLFTSNKGHSKMRTVPNCILACLSFADLSMSIFNCAPNFSYIITK